MIKLLTIGLVTLFLALTIVIVSLIYFDITPNPFYAGNKETTNQQIRTSFLERRDLRTYEELNGLLGYESNINIASNHDGIITELPLEGEILERGDVIFKLYKSVTDLQILNADQQISGAMASVAQAELALENLRTPATESAILSADASIIQAEITLNNLTTPPEDSQIAMADAAILQAEIALQNLLDGPSESQIASAEAAVAQAELALENLNTPASDAQIAAADAAVAQAELALENLRAPASDAQIAAADAAVAQAELALENLRAPPSDAQIAAADAALIQAKGSFANAQSTLNSSWASRRSAHDEFCEQAYGKFLSGSLYLDTLCPVHDLAISTTTTETILKLIENNILVPESQSLLQAHNGYLSALNGKASTEANLLQATANRSLMEEEPTLLELKQLETSLDSALKQRALIDTEPSEMAIAHATAALLSAKSQRATLDELPDIKSMASAVKSLESARIQRDSLFESPEINSVQSAEKNIESAKLQRASLDDQPTYKELEQAKVMLNSSIEHRKSLDNGPTEAALNHAMTSLESAQASLHAAWVSREQFVQGYYGSILMYGPFPAWREFRLGMTPGEDVRYLEENLTALGFNTNQKFQIDQVFDEKTEEAIRRMQESYGLIVNGTLEPGDIVFAPGKSMVEHISPEDAPGKHITSSEIVISITPMEKTDTSIGRSGLTTSSLSLQRVETQLLVSDQDLIQTGSEVQIELPDETVVTGMITKIGKVAVVPTGNQAEDPFLEVSIAITDSKDIIKWTGAPVIVSVTKTFAKNVIAAPVSALLALLDGGYALEIKKQDTTILIPVETGIYSDGWVEIDGPGLTDGLEIVIPE
mgnify:CR=1 FL=1